MIQDEALVCHRHQASCLGGQDDRSTLLELQQKNKTNIESEKVV